MRHRRSWVVNHDVELFADQVRALESVVEVEAICKERSWRAGRAELRLAGGLAVAILTSFACPVEEGLEMPEGADLSFCQQPEISARLEIEVLE